ncbi:LuxR C-terminal-related transcriptional regulator [Microbulbifer sp. ALW1]|uniref:LuxR C-terminal-related transcriptional regulator n=1 Tax=Microbulbifer sp. (strain ALW1) TaxID=1516059 RepID=UPI001359B007|nr:LuxR C-terminal-related transcriptional regulator [Microbulbifer sp. ALW1]
MTREILDNKPQTNLLTDVWDQRKETFANAKAEPSEFRADELMGAMFRNGPGYHYIFDLYDLSLVHISPKVAEIHDLDPETVTFQDILNQVHPDDMPFVARAEEAAIRMFQDEIGIDKVKDYKISYCFRFRVKSGQYRLFSHQAVVLSTDNQGAISKALNIHTDISHLVSENNYQLSLIGMNGHPSYLNIDVEGPHSSAQSNNPKFSEREISVIRLIAKGLTSAEIGRRLTLSEYTIKNHRKRILKKSDCQNMSQLLSSGMLDGLL